MRSNSSPPAEAALIRSRNRRVELLPERDLAARAAAVNGMPEKRAHVFTNPFPLGTRIALVVITLYV
jgi:hypothetical protein